MKVQVLKAFRYVPEGFGGELFEPGVEANIREDMVQGLVDEGYVKAGAVKAAPKPAKGDDDKDEAGNDGAGGGAGEVEIPEDWKDLKGPALMKLAASLTDSAIKNKADAVAAIELELANRAGTK